MSLATKWMEMEIIISQVQKDKYSMFLLTWGICT
jgi:hypothetical protein